MLEAPPIRCVPQQFAQNHLLAICNIPDVPFEAEYPDDFLALG